MHVYQPARSDIGYPPPTSPLVGIFLATPLLTYSLCMYVHTIANKPCTESVEHTSLWTRSGCKGGRLRATPRLGGVIVRFRFVYARVAGIRLWSGLL